MQKLNVAILRNEDPFEHLLWVEACNDYKEKITYTIIDITKSTWLEEINNLNPDVLLLKPAGKTNLFRSLYTERVDVLVNDLKYKSYPTYNEIRIYESKRFFAYWAQANNIPHPKTSVFYSKKEVLNFIKNVKFPVVAKLNIGASGNGIEIIKSKHQLNNYVNSAFSTGLAARTGPKLKKGKLIFRIYQKITNPKELINKVKTYKEVSSDKQKGYLILQEFVPHEFEWRVVRIGDSFFAHKKIVSGQKASGSLIKKYDSPPLALLDFVKEVTDKHQFYSQAVDIFEKPDGTYLINEMQCIFGQSDPHQMFIDGVPGRYIYNKKWIFEEGSFNKNESYNLRIEYIINQYFKKS